MFKINCSVCAMMSHYRTPTVWVAELKADEDPFEFVDRNPCPVCGSHCVTAREMSKQEVEEWMNQISASAGNDI